MYELYIFDNQMNVVNKSWHRSRAFAQNIANMWYALGFSYSVEG